MSVDQIERPAAAAAISAATRAVATATATAPSRVAIHQQAALDRLHGAALQCRSLPLRRAIEDVIEKKVAADAAAEAHTGSDEADEEELVWNEAREALEAAAAVLAAAPIAGARDALIRGEALIDALDRDMAVTDVPCAESDQITHMRSLRRALEWLAGQEPDRTDWDDAVKALRDAEWSLQCAGREEDGLAQAALVEDGVRQSLRQRLNAAYTDRDVARTRLLAMDPPDAGGLLIQMEIVFDHAAVGDVSTYASRARLRGDEPITTDHLWTAEGEALWPAFALLAVNAAKLQDRSLPEEWIRLIDDLGYCHPNLRDAADQAIRAGLDPAHFSNIQLAGAPEDELPVLTFKGPGERLVYAKPSGCWSWRDVSELAGGEAQ